MRAGRIFWRAVLLSAALLLLAAPVALAAGSDVPLVGADFLGIGHAVGSVFKAIGGVVLGGLHWTVEVAGKFILATLGGLIRLLIPKSWARDGVGIMHWIVAVPDYAGTITSPGGHTTYGFAGINALRDLFMWLGAACLPLTLVYATSRAALGHGGPVAAPVARVLGLAAVLVSYPWWWSQAAAVIDQITHYILSLPPVTNGIYRLMQYAVGGAALGGWQLIDLVLMGALGLALLALIFLKVTIILAGALLYALGPLMLALVPAEAGLAVARAWGAAAGSLLALPVLWAAVFAVGALLINDAGTAGPLIAGSGTIAHLLGGLLLAGAGLASLWLCLRIAREVGGVLRGQLAGMLALTRSRGRASSPQPAPAAAAGASSVRSFARRIGAASAGALGEAGPAGALAVRAAGGLAALGRGGLLGAAGGVVRTGAAAAAPGTAALLGRSRAGAVAVRMGRAAATAPHHAGRSQSVSSSGPRPSARPGTGGPTPQDAGPDAVRGRSTADSPVTAAGGARVPSPPPASGAVSPTATERERRGTDSNRGAPGVPTARSDDRRRPTAAPSPPRASEARKPPPAKSPTRRAARIPPRGKGR